MTDITNQNSEDTSTETEQNTNTGEKKFTQEDLNKLLAKEKRTWQQKYDSLKSEHDTLLSEIETEKTQKEEQLKTKVAEMSKGLSPIIQKAVSKMTVEDAYEFLSDPESKIEKKKIPSTPQGTEDEGEVKQKPIGTIF